MISRTVVYFHLVNFLSLPDDSSFVPISVPFILSFKMPLYFLMIHVYRYHSLLHVTGIVAPVI